MTIALVRVCSAVGLVAMVACGSLERDPSWLVREPRVLGVRATPPVFSELTGTVTLDAIAIDATGAVLETPVRFRACSPWGFLRDPSVDCDSSASLEFEAQLSAAELLQRFPIPDGFVPPPGSNGNGACDSGSSLAVPIVAEFDDEIGIGPVVKYVTVLFGGMSAERSNPVFDGVIFNGAPGTALTPGTENELTIALNDATTDTVCIDGEMRRESIRVYYYATAGELSSAAMDIDPDGASDDPVRWLVPDTGDAALWVVAVDDDGGVHWERADF